MMKKIIALLICCLLIPIAFATGTTVSVDSPNADLKFVTGPDTWDEGSEVPDQPSEVPQDADSGIVPFGSEYYAPFDFGNNTAHQWQTIVDASYRYTAGTTLDVTGSWVPTSTTLSIELYHNGSTVTCWVGTIKSGQTKTVTLPLDGTYSIHVKPSANYTKGNLILVD